VPNCFTSLLSWSLKRWIVGAAVGASTYLLIALPTAVIKNPIFGREIAVTEWSVMVIVVTSVLTGLLTATYVKNDYSDENPRQMKIGSAGALLSFFAVGCPVCNKLVLIALGYSGAIQYFAPIQPYLALIGIALLMYSLRMRLNNEYSCSLPFQNSLSSIGEKDASN
jgi:ABC-type Fe3+-siderophore transport system permease subunit